MKKIKILSFFTISFILCQNIEAQNIGVDIQSSLGYPSIKVYRKGYDPLDYKGVIARKGNLGVIFFEQKKINYKTEIGFNYIKLKASEDTRFVHILAWQKQIIYLDIATLAGFHLLDNKLNIYFGPVFSTLAWVKPYENSANGLTNFLISLEAEISVSVSKKCSIFMRYSHQLNSVFDQEFKNRTNLKYRIAELGFGYKIK